MRKNFRKYLIPSLALMLILSNFSYAANIMLCSMNDSQSKCECMHKVNKKFSGLSFDKIRKSCCNEKSVELTNTNQLNTVKKECIDKCLSQVTLLNTSLQLLTSEQFGFPNTSLREQIPKYKISILNSSLLI